jgi:hypothetical protein
MVNEDDLQRNLWSYAKDVYSQTHVLRKELP